ncbi:MAG: methyltransferase domain-containing protein [Pseudonocardia sp.]
MFEIDVCRSCGHAFQNPRLTDTGLAYYYRDFYDGLGRDTWDSIFELSVAAYRARVAMLDGLRAPATWIDIGGGHGHFCREARRRLPGTEFWAIDRNPDLADAVGRGWLHRTTTTPLLDFAPEHAVRFDAVSMFHYLEHTAEPKLELQAGITLLREGGVLLIEMPNPESPFARWYGRFWHGWLVPQHLHLMPWRNVTMLLAENGLSVLSVELGKANQPFDTVGALLAAAYTFLPPTRQWPWLPYTASRRSRLIGRVGLAMLIPALLVAALADRLLHVLTKRGKGGNTYRIIAVRRCRQRIDRQPWGEAS